MVKAAKILELRRKRAEVGSCDPIQIFLCYLEGHALVPTVTADVLEQIARVTAPEWSIVRSIAMLDKLPNDFGAVLAAELPGAKFENTEELLLVGIPDFDLVRDPPQIDKHLLTRHARWLPRPGHSAQTSALPAGGVCTAVRGRIVVDELTLPRQIGDGSETNGVARREVSKTDLIALIIRE